MTSVAAAETSRRLARAALALALMYLALVAVQFSPTADAFFFTLAAALLMITLLLCGVFYAVLAYVGLALLAFATLGPALIWPFFAAYGLWVWIKMALEWLCFKKRWPLWRDWLLKALSAALLSLLARFVVADWLLGAAFAGLRQKLGGWVELWPLLLFVLILFYDYVLTRIRRSFVDHLWPHLR